ncbi:thioredoxin-dependent thiol peroxidase [Arthrobacter sp. H14-L1]|uniref:thioredoxin-dependent thiol peroxidase n=1 Tax=Arthrobacter sp. H14-L1 TaxID=2996697 RepID=UPI00226F6B6A|nr:thioredoxin-dependent thiol peroxidase [Arthrobacter sp. H14-L1]MCY0904985.1 thioredoxin-dependent thiol peroxidase [Arthrobacter sp. H14-L1]
MTAQLSSGTTAPTFSLQDASDNTISLSDFQGRNVVVYFYPAAATPGCTTEACDFRDSLGSLKKAGYEVVGISPDSPEKLRTFTEDQALTFPLLADDGAQVARAWGAWGHKTVNGKDMEGVLRSTFVLDGEGRVLHAAYNVAPTGHVAELRETLGVN